MSREELEVLLDHLFEFAKQMLGKSGEFHPFGAVVTAQGETKAVGAHLGTEHPPSQDVIDILTAALREQATAGEIRAAGVCIDVRVVPLGSNAKSDAICARLEHRDGEAIKVFLPYRKGFLRRLQYGEVFATEGERLIFTTAGQ